MYNRKYFIPTGKYRADISLPPRIPKTVTGAYFFWSISSPLVDVKSVVLVVYPLFKIWPPF